LPPIRLVLHRRAPRDRDHRPWRTRDAVSFVWRARADASAHADERDPPIRPNRPTHRPFRPPRNEEHPMITRITLRSFRPAYATATALAALCAGWQAQVQAHHSFAMYDQSQVRTFTGKLTRFIPGANHAQLLFELVDENGDPVLDADGKPIAWGVETGPAARIARQGVTPDTFPVGTI